MKRAGFTMIELVFVIVILGILAAVAIPKLAATRNDAKISSEITSASQAIQNLGAQYTAKGTFADYNVTDANESVKCFNITGGTNDGNATVALISAATTDCPQSVLSAITTLAEKNGIVESNGSAKTYSFGGVGVTY